MSLIKKRESVLESGMAKTKNKLKPINTPLFGCWKALLLSFYSKRLYIDVGKRWAGYGIRYLVLLIALWSIPLAIKVGIDFNEVFDQQLIEPLSIIPTIYIQNGEATFDKPMPYYVKNKKNQVVLIVDTTGNITDFIDKYPYLTILVNKDKVAFRMPGLQFWGDKRMNPNKPLIQYFGEGENLVFDGKKIVQQSTFMQWKYVAQLMIYPLVAVVFFSMFVFMFLVLGFLGQLFARIFFSFHLTLKQGCKLLMVSSTPMMLVLLGLLLFNHTFPGFGFLLIAVLATYFSFAVLSLKSESKRLVNV
jgi:hypothetical protein